MSSQTAFRLKQSQATKPGKFELTKQQAELLLALETGNILDKTVVAPVLEVFQRRPHWVRIIKAQVYGMGAVVSAKSTRLGRIAAKHALHKIELEEAREMLRKEQAAAAVAVGVQS